MTKAREFSPFLGVRIAVAVSAFVAGASFCLAGNQFHKASTFYYVNQLPIPWWVYGTLLLIAGVLLCFSRSRPTGYLVGGIVYTFFAIASWLAVLGGLHLHMLNFLHFPPGNVGNFFAACNITTISILYWSALRYSIYAQVDPERVNLASLKN